MVLLSQHHVSGLCQTVKSHSVANSGPTRDAVSRRVQSPGVAARLRDLRVKLGVARDLIQACKTVGSPLFHHVNHALWPANAVVLHNLGRHSEALGFICPERRHNVFRLGQQWRYATRVEAAQFVPDFLAELIGIDQLMGANGDTLERFQEAEFCECL